MSISLPLSKKEVSEDAINAIINKGGKTTVESTANPNAMKSIKLTMTVDEIESIKRLRDMRPAVSRNRKITISVHDWVIEAVQDKIKKERAEYGIKG